MNPYGRGHLKVLSIARMYDTLVQQKVKNDFRIESVLPIIFECVMYTQLYNY